jgi:hypothetical protein
MKLVRIIIALPEDEEMKIPGTNIVEELTQQFALIRPQKFFRLGGGR